MSKVKKIFYGIASITIDVSRIKVTPPPDHRTVFGEKFPPIEMDDGILIKIDDKKLYSAVYNHHTKWQTQDYFKSKAGQDKMWGVKDD